MSGSLRGDGPPQLVQRITMDFEESVVVPSLGCIAWSHFPRYGVSVVRNLDTTDCGITALPALHDLSSRIELFLCIFQASKLNVSSTVTATHKSTIRMATRVMAHCRRINDVVPYNSGSFLLLCWTTQQMLRILRGLDEGWSSNS